MLYRLTAKSGRRTHIDLFLRRLPDESMYEEVATPSDGVSIILADGPLPGFPPVLVEALEELPA